jgi:hypothetical protein
MDYIEIPEIEEKYQRLERLGLKLGVPVLGAHLEVKMSMPDGKVYRHWKQRSHSWTRNAYNLIFSQVAEKNPNHTSFGSGYLSFKNTGGNVAYCSFVASMGAFSTGYGSGKVSILGAGYSYNCNNNSDDWGIVLGSGSTAESIDDYKLATPIDHGIDTGKLTYSTSEATAISYSSGDKKWSSVNVRYINNNSQGDITLREIGLIASVSPYIGYVMMSRDVLGGDETIYDTAQVKVTYTISLTYPS